MLNQGFEDLSKKSLMARFIKLYPKIQSLLESESKSESDQLVVSQSSFDKRKKEYDHLVNVLLPENIKAIETAKEHGDLKENSEYKMARQDNDTLTARRANLETEMGKARVTDFKEATTDQVGIGSIVTVKNEDSGKTQTFSILGAWDSEPEKNIISYKTPLGQNLLSKKSGEQATMEIDGERNTWTIQSIERWVDKN